MKGQMENETYDVAVIGAGASGSSLFYTLAKYTDIPRVILIEKYAKPGQVNSRASNNSQTLHVGDIETNYSIKKVQEVKPAAMMVAQYAKTLPEDAAKKIMFTVPKMVLGVGEREVAMLEKRFAEISDMFPDLKKLSREEIALVEPSVMKGRDTRVPVVALATLAGYAVDFEELSQSFVDEALRAKPEYVASYTSAVTLVRKEGEEYVLEVKGRAPVRARAVVVDADSYSLYFAKQLGYGKNYSLIPIAGSFYFSKKVLNGKVYTVQEPLLPFAAIHGDPDVCVPNVTRWGPTARFYPQLESGNKGTMRHYAQSSGLGRARTWKSFSKILLEPVRFKYLLANMFYEVPWAGKRMLLKDVRKIAPSIRASDLKKAHGYGGMRLQRVNTDTSELELGEGKILGDNIIFNMTPSPGASVCLFNAMRDAEQVIEFLKGEYVFQKEAMQKDLA